MALRQTLGELYPPKPAFTEADVPSLSGKVYLITGGTSGIGLALAKILYAKNATVYITSRTVQSADKAIRGIKESAKNSTGQLAYLTMDLADLASIAPAIKRFLSQESMLHTVWYNAGVMNVPNGSKTQQGYELQWGTNVVAHFAMNKLLLPILLHTAKTVSEGSVRTVWVSSGGHISFSPRPDGIDWDDIKRKKPADWKGEKGSMTYYGQSKAGDVLLAWEAAHRYGKSGIVSVTLNPGHLKSNLQRDTHVIKAKIIDVLFMHDPYLGALTELYAGLSTDIGLKNNGAYVIPWGRLGKSRPDIVAGFEERGTGKRLWDLLEEEVQPFL